MAKTIVRVAAKEGTPGLEEDGKVQVISDFSAGGLAVTRLPRMPFYVTHMASGLGVAKAESASHARQVLKQILPLTDWTVSAEDLDVRALAPHVKKAIETPWKRAALSPVDKLLASPAWKGATVEGPMPHGEKLAYRVTLGSAVAWVWGGVEQPAPAAKPAAVVTAPVEPAPAPVASPDLEDEPTIVAAPAPTRAPDSIDLRIPALAAAYRAGMAESKRTDSNPQLCRCEYQQGSAEWYAFNKGWAAHYPEEKAAPVVEPVGPAPAAPATPTPASSPKPPAPRNAKGGSVYDVITDRILAMLEAGTVPWRKPWVGGPAGIPKNLKSGKEYRGLNVFLLHAAGYGSPYWLTFKQALDMGGHVRKGEAGMPVVFWKRYHSREEENEDGETVRKTKEIPVLRYYTVFNVDQCEGIDYPKAEQPAFDFKPIEAAEAVVAGMPKRPEIVHVHPRAFYSLRDDAINMPKPQAFERPAEYYSTLFHELGHSTGHASRVGRPGITQPSFFGSPDYSREELVAEMTAAFLCGHCSIEEQATFENSAAYVASWIKALRADNKAAVIAAAQAQKAADFILGKRFDGEAESEA